MSTTRPASEAGAAAATPGTRPAGHRHGALLMAISCLPVLGAVLLAPVLPAMQDHFADTPGADALVPITLTVPALMIGLTAPFAGRIVDRFGRLRLLVGALLAYAVLGMAPLVLEPLPAIVLSRAGVGLTEAAIMTCCTTLIADYFAGADRDRWLGLQTVTTALAATVFFGLGGGLGSISWRAPFWLYASSLIFAVLTLAMLPKVRPADGSDPKHPAREPEATTPEAALPPIPWAKLRVPVAVTFFGGIVFYTPIVELPYVLDGLGVDATSTIGALAALASLATAIGAASFGRQSRRGTRVLLPVALGLAGIGLAGLGLAPSVPLAAVAAVVASAGTGLLLPTLITWAISGLSFVERGRGTGLWTAALFLGEFVCPLLVLALAAAAGGTGLAVSLVGLLALVLAVASRALVRPAAAAA
ncbi:MFS transporter [Nocardioides sp. GY 10127]|uniref:MFS transporter n=1 Tax=Nocardioides sp. GY 10127 TaxID=2569762 RepID=UPI0010A77980|nr:MFS transporter [Nocardioides sp. GY 10127]TIC82633.1 MFS transporter [Nocardioides sp. GY 10127]